MSETVGDALRVEKDGAALRVTFNRPQQLNAFTAEMLGDLCDLLDEASADSSVRVVIVSAGGRAFSSGADLKTIGASSNEPGMDVLRQANRVVRAMRAMPQPVIAAVNGPAVGVGCSVALACDLVMAAESAYFLLPFVGIALMPDGGATALVPAAVGRSRALGMALLGDRVPASEAERWGLIYRVVADDELDSQVAAVVDRFAAGSPPAVAATKHAINDLTLASLDAALDAEAQGQAKLLSSADFAEAAVAFAERRPPRFSGR